LEPVLELLNITITNRQIEADGIVSLEVQAPGGGPLPPFEAGAHVDFHVKPGLVRQYSICNDPTERHRYLFGILLEPESRGGSAAVHEEFVVGRTVTISAPRNNFKLREDAATSILLAGGIGVTPLLAMSHRLHTLRADFALHYCTRTRSRTAFMKDLTQGPFAERVHIHHDDGPADQLFSVDTSLPAPNAGTHVYVCGPTGFMDYVTAGVRRNGWDDDRVHLEYFSNDLVETAGGAFTVIAARSGRTFSIPAEKTILQVLEANGIRVPVSCEQGVCGTCLTPIIEGTADHRDLFQTDKEKAANTHMTVCCSRASSASITLDL
jgi:vanillate O-demethylase ferredoxin subunit